MAVLMTADVPGQTEQGYDGMLAAVRQPLQSAPGFIAHMAADDGQVWRITEIWESVKDATAFYAKYVDPQLPAGVKPKRKFHELHSLVRPEVAAARLRAAHRSTRAKQSAMPDTPAGVAAHWTP